MSGGLNFEYGFNTKASQRLNDKASMRMYFLGDFTGAQSASESINSNLIVKVDIDNFDDIMTKLSPTIELPDGHKFLFNELEDFHPDNLFNQSVFKNLRRLKRELNNPSTADRAAQEIISLYQLSPQHQEYTDTNLVNIGENEIDSRLTESKDNMFERLLGQKQSSLDSTTIETKKNVSDKGVVNLDNFLSNLLSPLIINDAKPEHKSLMLIIDTAINELMRTILHSTEFKALESAWRSVRNVIFNEPYDENTHLFYLVNTSRDMIHIAAEGDTILTTKLANHIKNSDDDSYDVLIGNYQFSAKHDDITDLNYLACLAEMLQCQFLSSIDDTIINAGTGSLWHQLRQTPQAKSVALSYPKILLRLPYGKTHDDIDAFNFEEFDHNHPKGDLLWGNSAFLCAQLLIRQYNNSTNGQEKLNTIIAELPAYVYSEDDEQKLHPCGEVLFSEQQLIQIRNQGVMAFVSYRNKNAIHLFSNEISAINI